MAKVEWGRLTSSERRAFRRVVHDTVMALGDKRAVVQFLDDILTGSEIIMLARRIQIAQRLLLGRPLLKIRNDLKVGFSTIEGVGEWLTTKFGDYRKVIPPLVRARKFRKLQRCYPRHFPLLKLLLRW